MNELEMFKYENKEVRTKILNDEIYFCLKDVCNVLELKNPSIVAQRLEEDEVTKFDLGGLNGLTNYVNEGGLYSVILRSDKPEAKKFKKWVTSEVLPSIRKHGAYITEDTLQKALTSPDFLIQLATNLKLEQENNAKLIGEIQIKQQLIEELKPIKEYVDVILSSNESLTVTQIAADYGLSATKLNSILQEERIQRKVNGQWILYIDHQSKGYTKSETVNIGNDRTKLQTKWTQKGRLKIHEILTKLGYKANTDLQNIT